MKRIVLKTDPELFKEEDVIFQGSNFTEIRPLKHAQLGNFLHWRYFIENDIVKFFKLDKNGNAHLYEGNGPDVKPGDYIWFEADKNSVSWGLMQPPKGNFRKAFWERHYITRKELFHHSCTETEMESVIYDQRNKEDKNKIEDVNNPNWYFISHAQIKNGNKVVAFADLYRVRSKMSWSISGVYIRKGYATIENANKLLDEIEKTDLQ